MHTAPAHAQEESHHRCSTGRWIAKHGSAPCAQYAMDARRHEGAQLSVELHHHQYPRPYIRVNNHLRLSARAPCRQQTKYHTFTNSSLIENLEQMTRALTRRLARARTWTPLHSKPTHWRRKRSHSTWRANPRGIHNLGRHQQAHDGYPTKNYYYRGYQRMYECMQPCHALCQGVGSK